MVGKPENMNIRKCLIALGVRINTGFVTVHIAHGSMRAPQLGEDARVGTDPWDA